MWKTENPRIYTYYIMETQKKTTRDASPTVSRSKLVADGVECKNPELGKSIAAKRSFWVVEKYRCPKIIYSIGNPGV